MGTLFIFVLLCPPSSLPTDTNKHTHLPPSAQTRALQSCGIHSLPAAQLEMH